MKFYAKQAMCRPDLCSSARYWNVYECEKGSLLCVYWFKKAYDKVNTLVLQNIWDEYGVEGWFIFLNYIPT